MFFDSAKNRLCYEIFLDPRLRGDDKGVRGEPPKMMTAAQRQAIHPQKSVWVTASAGSGKTKVLTDRLLALLMAGNAPHRLLCLTFTKAAAAEMANRLHLRLSQWAVMPPDQLEAELASFNRGVPVTSAEKTRARQLFSLLLETPGGFKIQTLHSFCQSLLRRFPLEAGLAPHFTVLDDRSAQDLLKKAQDHILPQPELAQALQQLTNHLQENRLVDLMQQGMAQPAALRALLDHHGDVATALQSLEELLGVDPAQTPEGLVQKFCEDPHPHLPWVISLLKPGGPAQPLSYPAYRRLFLTENGAPRKRIASAALLKTHPPLGEALQTLQDALLAFEEKRKTAQLFQNSQAFLVFLSALSTEYTRLKRQKAVLDYDDLIHKTLQLLTARNGNAAWVLYKLDGGIDHILVDEAQDTSKDQWRVIQALSAEFFTSPEASKTLFVVGDPKQSIYRFQGADPASFEKLQTILRHRVQAHQGTWCDVALDVSFRSAPAILQGVDHTFFPESLREGLSIHPLQHLPCPAKENLPGLVEIWPLVPLPEKPQHSPWALPLHPAPSPSPQAILAEGIAVAIQGWITQKEILFGHQRPLRAGDILILVRRRSPFVDTLVRFLKEKNIPVAGVDRLLFLEHLAIMDLVCLGEFLLLPEDDLTLATVLKSPLVGLSEENLFTLAYGREKCSLWSVLKKRSEEGEPWASATRFLSLLLEKSKSLSPYAFYQMLLGPLKGRQKILSRLGAEAQDPLDELLTLALAYEQSHPPSLQGFLAWLSRREVEVKRDFAHNLRDDVRIMTVHGAKGLQAPVVILPDTCQPPRASTPFFWHHDDKGVPSLLWNTGEDTALTTRLKEAESALQIQEYRRLLYVALTRAEERLYVCGWQNTQTLSDKSWFSSLTQRLKDHPLQETFSFTLPFSKTWAGEGIRLKTGTSSFVFKEEPAPVLKAPEGLPAWIRRPPAPEPFVEPVFNPSPRVERTQQAALTEGTILHRLLHKLPHVAPAARVEVALRMLKQDNFPEKERLARIQQIISVLENPDFSFLFGPSSVAEVAITGKRGNSPLLGQVDRLVVEEKTIKIVDFKTHRTPPTDAIPAIYIDQMAAYQAAVQPLYPDKAILCGLLWITTGHLQWIPPLSP